MQKTNELPNTSMAAEKHHLKETLAVIYDNIENYGRDVSKMAEEIEDMLEHFHDDNPELINTLENKITMHDHLKRALERNEKARKKPYFGRIIFQDESLNKQESLYIGKGGISRDAANLTVIDWRAAVAAAYYENGLGKCSYLSPQGKELLIDLQLKRTFEIEEGNLLNFFDTEVVSNDELLTKYLSKNKEAVLGEIVATIQKEQNAIIRKSPFHNMIVQGVAGSGKTTVAMHRISYILYNYEERFKPNDFYIVGSNRILLNYITSVLPDLDVEGVKQMTMEELFVRLLYEDWDNKKYNIKSLDKSNEKEMVKGRLDWFHDLEAYCKELEWNTICRENIYLKGKYPVLLVKGEDVENYIRQNPQISLQNKINTLNERLRDKVKDNFIASVRYSEEEKKRLLSANHSKYGPPSWKKSIFAMYEDFLMHQSAKGYEVKFPETAFDLYDLAALAYLYKRIKETEVISEAHHVVIDEAQDFGMMAYSVLKFCIKGCTYTIMGDVSQNIHYEYGLNDWEDLKKLFLSDTDRASFNILKKSYRNTVEISNFAANILHHGNFSVYPIEPIIRHGKEVVVTDILKEPAHSLKETTNFEKMIYKTAEICKEWQNNALSTIAVICRNQAAAKMVSKSLGQIMEVKESDLEQLEFGNGIMVLPVEYTKGLEFDAVLIFNPTEQDYPCDNGHAKLLYVAATRALHELRVLHAGNLTALISAPVPEKSMTEFLETSKIISKSQPQTRARSTKPSVSIKPKAEKAQSGTAFGDIPATEILRPAGHSKIDLSVKWINKQTDGIYLQSKYSILRISPVRSDIVRITFAKGSRIMEGRHPKIAYEKGSRACGYRETPKTFDFVTDELYLQIDKASGAVTYMTRDKKLLLKEKSSECRQIEVSAKGAAQSWLYLDWQKDENIFGHRIADKLGANIRKSARYISHGNNTNDLPMLISDKGYGIVIATDGVSLVCDIPVYGSYIFAEQAQQMDYYFIAGKNTDAILKAYQFLRGGADVL